jgi:RNA polymerase sigma-70 factor (ECF subfamily)
VISHRQAVSAASEATPPGGTPHPPEFTTCVSAFAEEFDFVHRALRRYGVSPADAEDLVQDVFLVMWRRWGDFHSDRPLRPWLAGIAFHLAQKHGRRRHREVPDANLDAPDERPQAEEHLAAAHARRLVLRALAAIPDRHRAPIVMHDLDGLSVQDIAAALDIPLSTAYTRLRRARLAFTAAVRRLRSREPELTLENVSAAALLALESPAPPAPAEVRARALARARRALSAPPPVVPARPLWPLAAGAVAIAVSALAISTRSSPAAVKAASMTAPAAPMAAPSSLGRGLIGLWRFEDGPDSQIARDRARGNDCVVRHPRPRAWIDGPVGGALRLGPMSWLECPQPAVASDAEISVAAWVQRDRQRKFHGVLASRQWGSDRLLFTFAVYEESLVIRSDAWPIYLRRALPGPLERWVHVAFTRSADGTVRLYEDGTRVAEEHTTAPETALVESPLFVGAAQRPAAPPNRVVSRLYGALDELALYDRALSDQEISALARGVSPL